VRGTFGVTGDNARELNTVEDLSLFVQQGITIMMYYGDADFNKNWTGGEAVSELVSPHGFSSAGYVNISPRTMSYTAT
jgi:hypothetical protein